VTSQLHDEHLGKLAYDAYATQTGGVSLVSGQLLPPWSELNSALRTAWIAAARTVEAHVRLQREERSA
jgi:hypothetical protein